MRKELSVGDGERRLREKKGWRLERVTTGTIEGNKSDKIVGILL